MAERHLGYLDAMHAYGQNPPAEWTCEIATETFDESVVAALLKEHRPEAVVCKSDEFAALFLGHVLRMGIRVPDDLKLVGFDDRPIASLLPVTLTSIRQPIQEIAEAALQLMESRIAQGDRPCKRIQIAGELMCRQSSM